MGGKIGGGITGGKIMGGEIMGLEGGPMGGDGRKRRRENGGEKIMGVKGGKIRRENGAGNNGGEKREDEGKLNVG